MYTFSSSSSFAAYPHCTVLLLYTWTAEEKETLPWEKRGEIGEERKEGEGEGRGQLGKFASIHRTEEAKSGLEKEKMNSGPPPPSRRIYCKIRREGGLIRSPLLNIKTCAD